MLSNRWTLGFIGSKWGFVISHGSLALGPCNPWRSGAGWVWYDPFQEDILGWEPSYAFAPSRVVTMEYAADKADITWRIEYKVKYGFKFD